MWERTTFFLFFCRNIDAENAHLWVNYGPVSLVLYWAISRLVIYNCAVCCGLPVSKLPVAHACDVGLSTHVEYVRDYDQTSARTTQHGKCTWSMWGRLACLARPIYIHTRYPTLGIHFDYFSVPYLNGMCCHQMIKMIRYEVIHSSVNSKRWNSTQVVQIIYMKA